MRKRLSSKLLAVILTIAICATTVLGCLMTVSAEASCYTFGTAQFAEDDLTEATIDVTFTANNSLPNGFSAGAFSVVEVDADAEDYLILKDVKPVTEGINLAESEDVDNYYIFDGEAKKSVTFTLTYGFSKGEANDAGKEYKIKLTEVELAYGDGAYFVQDDANGAVGTISAACKHVIGVVGEPLVTNKPNNYSVYAKSVCTLCGEEFGYQLVPTADKLGGDAADSEGATIQWDGTSKTAPTEGSGTETDPYIISDVAHLAYIAEAGPDVTHGKYYKVADGIKNIVLQSAADAEDLINIDSAEEARAYIEGLATKNRWGSSKYDAASAFAGFFDGNGATVYGMASNGSANVSLFGSIAPNAEFKNLSIKNSFIQTGWYAATLAHVVRKCTLANGTEIAKGTVKIDNCTFANNYLNPQSGVDGGTAGNQCVAVIIGQSTGVSGSGLAVNKVMTYGNVTYYEQQQAYISPLFGNLTDPPGPNAETKTEYCELMDCIFLDVTGDILVSDSANFRAAANVENVYTDATTFANRFSNSNDAKLVTKAQMLGSSAVTAAPNLDWGKTWLAGAAGELPRLAAPDYVSDTIYWDGSNTKTAPTVGTGKKDDPYIISTIAEFAYITGQTKDKYTITDGKYYKIADGIKNIVMQPYAYANDIMALDSAAATKSYFEANAAKLKQWLYYGWEGSTFCGNIDFNGATVYGIYQVSSNNAGLISNVEAGAVISNLTIKNSYMVSQSPAANYQVGAIGAVSNASSYGKKVNGIIWAQNCTVANNYMYGNAAFETAAKGGNARSGVLFGSLNGDAVYVDNCLVYGNDATLVDGSRMPLYASAGSTVKEDAVYPEDLVIKFTGTYWENGVDTSIKLHTNMIRNSIVLGCDPYDLTQDSGYRFNDINNAYENVYTDADIANDKFANGTAVSGIKGATQITVSDALGSAAQTAMPNLTWGTDWYCGAEGEYPIQKSFATFGTSSVATPSLQLVGTNVTYKNDGSLDLNIHFVPQTAGISPTLYVGTLDGSKFMKLNAVASSQTATLGANALMYVIPNLSARDIELVWLPTLVYAGSTVVQWGKSEQIALADNARAVIAGDYAQADKNVAAALLNYGAASGVALDSTYDYDAGTIDLLEFGDYLVEAGSTSRYWDTKVADNGETGDSWENAIIIDSAEELVYLCKASGNETAGKYYKVADGIAGFNLATNKLDITKSLAENLDVIKGSGKNHAGNTPGFQGHFDGNGATVYGAWTSDTWNTTYSQWNTSTYAGLFSCTSGTVTIKNINVKQSYFVATAAAGGIVGYYTGVGTGSLTIENCSVTDCYIETWSIKDKKDTTKTPVGEYGHGIGALVGYAHNYGNSTNGPITVNNCYVNLDEEYFVSPFELGTETQYRGVHGGLLGFVVSNYTNNNAGNVTNCVVIGITPYATENWTANNDVQHSGLSTHFNNIYTDAVSGSSVNIGGNNAAQNLTGRVTQLTLEQMTGDAAKANMPSLDWNNVWTTTSGYPTFINKNYKAPASGITVTWDGTVATGFASGTGTKEDPYIISTASEFAYMVKDKIVSQAATISPNKYFKVADGISAFVMQKPEYASEIIALGSAADTKAYFEANKANMLTWPFHGWEGSSFCGHFDGNGATVYGLYQKSDNNAGLFSGVDAGAVISNIALKNSYLTSKATNYQVAGIAAVANSGGYGVMQEGVIWINGCTVANNYMYNASTAYSRSGVIAGSFQNDIVMIDNCLTYGNDATYGDGVKMAVVGQGNNDVEITKLKPAELPSYVEDSRFFCNTVRNSIILDCDVINEKEGASYRRNAYSCYSNVYTNGTLGETFNNGSWATQYAKVLFPITADDIKGDSATAIVNALNAAQIGETVWYVGAAGDNPGFKAAGTMSSATQALYDGMVLTNADNYGDSVDGFGVYGTGLNLKVNPYMTFTFVFGYEYAKEDIQVTFKSGDTVIETVTAADMTNNEGAGRFHLYRLKNAPVTALSTGITVSVTYGSKTTDFGTYSAEGFAIMADNASKLEPCDYYANLYEASKALLFYADMLAARYSA